MKTYPKTITTDPIMGNHPYSLGQEEAQEGLPCCPEYYFQAPDSIVHYVLGFISIAGENDTTRQIMGLHDSPDIDKTLTEMKWEWRWQVRGEWRAWHPILEDQVKGHLMNHGRDADYLLFWMAEEPGRTISTSDGEFRFITLEEPADAIQA